MKTLTEHPETIYSPYVFQLYNISNVFRDICQGNISTNLNVAAHPGLASMLLASPLYDLVEVAAPSRHINQHHTYIQIPT